MIWASNAGLVGLNAPGWVLDRPENDLATYYVVGALRAMAMQSGRLEEMQALHDRSEAVAAALGEAFPRASLAWQDVLAHLYAGHHDETRARLPDLEAAPHVVPLAEAEIDKAGMAERIDTVAGDFFADEHLPGGHDVALLSAILHDWDEDTGRMLLAKCHDALPPGGVLLISEMLLDDDRTGPPSAALMGLNMLVETEGGRNYAEGEYREWLLDAGFREVTRVPCGSGLVEDLLVARA